MTKRKFNIGDTVIGLPSANEAYLVTKQGCIAIVRRYDPSGKVRIEIISGTREICIGEEYHVSDKYFELYKQSKTTDMAAKKKAATKKAVKKVAVAAPPSDKIFEGDYFSADYKENPKSKTAPVKIMGVVGYLDDEIHLDNPTTGEDDDESEEFSYSIKVELERGKSIRESLAEGGVTNFIVLTDARQKAIVDSKKNPEIGSYRVKIDGDMVSFGCGSVELHKSDIVTFNKVLQSLTTKEFDSFIETVRVIEGEDEGILDSLDSEEVAALVARL